MYSRVREWRNSRDVLDGKKNKDYERIIEEAEGGGGKGEGEGEQVRDNGSQLLFANFHQRGGDCVRSLFAARPNAK